MRKKQAQHAVVGASWRRCHLHSTAPSFRARVRARVASGAPRASRHVLWMGTLTGPSDPDERAPLLYRSPVLYALADDKVPRPLIQFMTALGSAAVVINRLGLEECTYRKVLDFMLGVSAGVMMAASYWSLLAPALEFAELQGWSGHSYVPVALGFLSGGVLLQGTDWWLSRMQGSLEELDLYKGLAVSRHVPLRLTPLHHAQALSMGWPTCLHAITFDRVDCMHTWSSGTLHGVAHLPACNHVRMG